MSTRSQSPRVSNRKAKVGGFQHLPLDFLPTSAEGRRGPLQMDVREFPLNALLPPVRGAGLATALRADSIISLLDGLHLCVEVGADVVRPDVRLIDLVRLVALQQ